MSMTVEVRSAVFQVRTSPDARGANPSLHVLLQTGDENPMLPGGVIGETETLAAAARGHLSAQCGLTRVAHLEQLSVFSAPQRVPDTRTIASTYLGLVPADVPAELSATGQWCDVDSLPTLAYDHAEIVRDARDRLAAKLSYTNIAFALAPDRFPMSELAEIYGAALAYPVDATNLLRVLSRRGVVVSTGTVGRTGAAGGRPPSLYTFADDTLVVTDEFATLRPPM